ncbi:MAG: hypothetical protein JRI67_10655 [Deltaproteobacteria bacterium]|nr:hypothetical protein [Deltaproteobacteria bacterium]
MGATGYIVWYDKQKIDEKLQELKCELPINWQESLFKVDGHDAYFAYCSNEHSSWHDYVWPNDSDTEEQKILKTWAYENARICEQDIWT